MFGTQATANAPEWLQYVAAFAPLSTLAAAVIAGWIAWRTLAQRREADRRDQWWQRTQWAIDLAMDRDFSRSVVGLVTLKHLAESDLCTAEDYEMLDKIGGAKIDALTLSDLTLSEESAEKEAQPDHTPGTRPPSLPGPSAKAPSGTGPSGTGPSERTPSAQARLIPVHLGSRNERVFATSAGMAKALEEADRLVSFAASRRARR
jgi:hypothetical protein